MNPFKIIILFAITLGLIGCGRSASNLDETSTEIQSETINPERPKPTENSQKPSKSPNPEISPVAIESPAPQIPQSSDQKTEKAEPNSPNPSPTSQPKSPDSQNNQSSQTPKTETKSLDPSPTQTEYNFKPDEEPIVPVGNFEFQLKQASLKKELVDPSTQKSYSAKSANKPSYYLFVELDLTNRSDRTAFDLFRYQLDCGDGKPIENAADAAVAYRSHQNLNVFAEIQPGETGTVADGFLVPESCLNSDQMTLNIFSAGEGKGEVPIHLK